MPQYQHSLDNDEKDRPLLPPLNTAASSFVPHSLPATHETVIYAPQHQQVYCPRPFLCTYEHLGPTVPVPRFVPAPLANFIPVNQPAPYQEISTYVSSPLLPEPLIQDGAFNLDEEKNRLTPRSELKRKVMMQLKKDD